MNNIDKLLSMFDELEELKRYKKFEETMNGDKVLLKKIAKMKAIQRQLVNAKAISKKNAIKQFESEYELIRHEVETNPLIETYLDLQDELNQILIEIKEIIETEINKELTKYNFNGEK